MNRPPFFHRGRIAREAALKAIAAKKHWQHMTGMAEFFTGMEILVMEAESRLEKADCEAVRTRNDVWDNA